MGVTRQLIFIVEPETSSVSTLSFKEIPDGNSDDKAITCCHIPPAGPVGIQLMEERMFLGTNNEAGIMLRTLDSMLNRDGTETIRSEFITNRIDPENRADSQQGRDSNTKRYEWLDLNAPNLTMVGGVLYWQKDIDPVRDPLVTWRMFNIQSGDTRGYFENGLANHVHIRGVHDQELTQEIHLSGFAIHYNLVGKGEGRDS